MRILFVLLAVPLLGLSAQAQTSSTTAPAKTTTSAHKHLSTEQRFEQANVTHDGHLTEEQAQAGYKSIAKHFATIDKDKKGYVTQDDIRAYTKMQQTLHHQASATHRQPNG